jgi:hypothetical protein
MKELYKALAAFQAEVPNIYKNSQGYGYKFADLGKINDIIKPLLTKNGLGYIQPIQGTAIKTIVFHVESGESIESLAEIPQGVQLAKMNEFQVLGSAITYLRRYSLSSILGLITDEDADAAGEQVKTKATPVIRNRTEEIKGGAEPFNDEADTLKRAKEAIKTQMIMQDYVNGDQMKAFIKGVLQKETIDSLNDADAVADALDNEQ